MLTDAELQEIRERAEKACSDGVYEDAAEDFIKPVRDDIPKLLDHIEELEFRIRVYGAVE